MLSEHLKTRREVVKTIVAASVVASASGALADEKKIRVAGLFDGPITDKNWAQFGYEGLLQVKKNLGWEIAYTDRLTIDQYAEVLRNYARQGFDRVVGHSGGFMEPALEVAPEYPNTQFIVINGQKTNGKNITSYIEDAYEQGYLMGSLAALMTKTKKVAQVQGVNIPVEVWSEQGTKAAMAQLAPDATFRVVSTGSWTDANKAREAAVALIQGGVDVLIPSGGGQLDIGTFTAAEDKKVMLVGNSADPTDVAPNATIGILGLDVTKLFYTAASSEPDAKVHKLGIKAGILTMTTIPGKVPQAVADKVAEIARDLSDGKLRHVEIGEKQ